MADNNGGVNFVWVLSDEEKARGAALAAILFVIGGIAFGGYWLWHHFLPSGEERVSAAQSAQYRVEENLRFLDENVKSLEAAGAAAAKGDTNGLEYLGQKFREVRGHGSEAEDQLKVIEGHAHHLKKSDQVDLRVSGAGFEKFASDARGKLQQFKERYQKVTAQVGDRLPKE
jgi:hypothetical protein